MVEGETTESGNGVLSVTIKDTAVLHASWMPFVSNGGLFIPTDKAFEIGDEVFVLLDLMEEAEEIPIAGKVVWITPKYAQDKRAQGVGIQFLENQGELIKKIENYLAGMLNSEKPTHTM